MSDVSIPFKWHTDCSVTGNSVISTVVGNRRCENTFYLAE